MGIPSAFVRRSLQVALVIVVVASVGYGGGVVQAAGPDQRPSHELGSVAAQQTDWNGVTNDSEPNDDRSTATPLTDLIPGRNEGVVGGTISGSINQTPAARETSPTPTWTSTRSTPRRASR
ncbi:hypothetical protein [Halococcus hamelinensis]|uniref:Uncharacterized protein n=1 Tax=Halococcus hamelinensis 100A6 TaxID=1132509 RepID=M0M8F1_9EURY|nr:hypothetical protein [Halococcus hamelinensis]EMA40685.1 hypothetical protein C447_04166 [Halococcus hamelinensis 100A6]